MIEKPEAWNRILKRADLLSSWPQKIQVDHETFEAVERDEQQKFVADGFVRILSKVEEGLVTAYPPWALVAVTGRGVAGDAGLLPQPALGST